MKNPFSRNWKKTVLESKFILPLFLVITLLVSGSVFFRVNTNENYQAHLEVERNVIEHPEFIPTASSVKIASSGYASLVSDFYWLDTIQYIGSNAISASYKAYLYELTGLVTDLSPHFTYPYQIALLLLPDVNERYESISENEKDKNVQNSIKLGEKAIATTCDMKKVEAIRKRFDLETLFNDASLKNPCEDALIPYYLAYVEYWSANHPEKASEWYRVAAMNDAAPKGARIMSAIMQGKTGNREKSIIMFLSLAEGMDPSADGMCRKLTGQLRSLLVPAFSGGAKLDKKFLIAVEKARAAAQEALGEKQEEIEKTDVSAYCSSYLNKAVREMNMAYVQEGDNRYFRETGKHAKNAKELFDKKYLDYLPRDYQKGNDGYEIIYAWKDPIQAWDFEMGRY